MNTLSSSQLRHLRMFSAGAQVSSIMAVSSDRNRQFRDCHQSLALISVLSAMRACVVQLVLPVQLLTKGKAALLGRTGRFNDPLLWIKSFGNAGEARAQHGAAAELRRRELQSKPGIHTASRPVCSAFSSHRDGQPPHPGPFQARPPDRIYTLSAEFTHA